MEEKHNMFPSIVDTVSTSYDVCKRSAFYYPLMKKCLENEQSGKSIVDALFQMGISRIGLYAVNEFMDYVLRDTNLSKLSEVLIYDRNYENYKETHLGKNVKSPAAVAKDYRDSKIEKIVICNLLFPDEIFTDLVSRGIKREDILTIDAFIY